MQRSGFYRWWVDATALGTQEGVWLPAVSPLTFAAFDINWSDCGEPLYLPKAVCINFRLEFMICSDFFFCIFCCCKLVRWLCFFILNLWSYRKWSSKAIVCFIGNLSMLRYSATEKNNMNVHIHWFYTFKVVTIEIKFWTFITCKSVTVTHVHSSSLSLISAYVPIIHYI